MTYKRAESVLVVIYSRTNQVLVMQRNDDANFWQSVTGAMEAGESPMQTALRELKEETGIDAQHKNFTMFDCRTTNQYEIRKQWQHRYAPNTKVNIEYVFAIEVSGDESIVLTEHQDYIWLTKQESIEKVWSDTNKQAIERFVPDE